MAMRDWIKQKMPDKVFTEAAQEQYLRKDWDVPPQPENLVRMGLAATLEEAQTLIAKDKTLWGGTRAQVPLDAMEAMFGSQFPTIMPLGGKPRVYTKFEAADDVRDGTGAKIGERGYKPLFAEWLSAGLIN